MSTVTYLSVHVVLLLIRLLRRVWKANYGYPPYWGRYWADGGKGYWVGKKTSRDSWINGRSAKQQVADGHTYRMCAAGPDLKPADAARVPPEGTGLWDKARKDKLAHKELVVGLVMFKRQQVRRCRLRQPCATTSRSPDSAPGWLQDDPAIEIAPLQAELSEMDLDGADGLEQMAKELLLEDLEAYDAEPTHTAPGPGLCGGYYGGVVAALGSRLAAASTTASTAQLQLEQATMVVAEAESLVAGDPEWSEARASAEELELAKATRREPPDHISTEASERTDARDEGRFFVKTRERALTLLAAVAPDDPGVVTRGPEDGGRPKEEEEEEEEEDQALWLQQMASNAAAGNLDLADLAEPASLPTLLRLLALPSLRAPVCEAIVSMASGAASEEAPSVGWGAVLRPLLDADRKLAGTSAWPTLAIEAVLAWRHRASIAEEAATDGDAKKLADVASPPPPPPSLSMRGGRAAAAAAIGRWGYARQRLAAAP
jgi:hypothetical protein